MSAAVSRKGTKKSANATVTTSAVLANDFSENIAAPPPHLSNGETQYIAEPNSSAVEDLKESPARPEPRGICGVVARLKNCFFTIIPPGGIVGSAFNLASTSIGAGILGLPMAANNSGLLMALLYLAVITYLTGYSMYILAVVAQRTRIRTLEGISGALLGRWAALIVSCIRGFHAFSACVAYIISVGDILRNLLSNSVDAPSFLKSLWGIRLLTVAAWLVLMLPFVIPRHIDSLRYFSTFAVIFMVYFVIIIVVHSCMNGLPTNIRNISVTPGDNSNVVLFNSGNKAIEGLGVFMFAYVCQITGIEVYWDMKERTIARYTLSSTLGLVLVVLLYMMTAFFGYLDFGREVKGSILLMYNPLKEPAVMVAYIGVLSKLCASYAIIALSNRNAIYHAIGWDPETVPFWKHCIAVITLSIFMLVCGLFIPSIQIVLGFAGSITGGSLGFVLPALFVMYAGNWSWRSVGAFNYICTYFLLFSGVIGIVFGTGSTIYGLIVR